MLSNFFLGPSCLCLGHRHHHDAGGRSRDPLFAHIAVSPHRAPSIYIQSYYPGLGGDRGKHITQIIEQKMTGLARCSTSPPPAIRAGSSRIELTFAPGTDPDLAWAKVQNKLQLAMASLPAVVQRQGIHGRQGHEKLLMLVGLVSEDGSMDGNDLMDYMQSEPGEGGGTGARRGRGRGVWIPVRHAASGSILTS